MGLVLLNHIFPPLAIFCTQKYHFSSFSFFILWFSLILRLFFGFLFFSIFTFVLLVPDSSLCLLLPLRRSFSCPVARHSEPSLDFLMLRVREWGPSSSLRAFTSLLSFSLELCARFSDP